jgi:diguanylate cyclase (GGDEF)-like protein/PAS domain S-box-containing protein
VSAPPQDIIESNAPPGDRVVGDGRPTVERTGAEALLDLAPDPTLVLDGTMRILHANRACETFFGRSLLEWVGRTPVDLVHPDDLAHVLSSFTEVQGKTRGSAIEIRVLTPNGWRYVEAIGGVTETSTGPLVTISLRDLTERRRWEVASGRPERFQSILQHAAAVILLLDADGSVDSVSLALTRQLGHDPAQVVGTPLTRWVTPPDRAHVTHSLASVPVGGSAQFEAELLHVDGTPIPYQFHVVNLTDDPVVSGVVVSATDISPRRALERRLLEMASRDDLTGLANRATLLEHLSALCARREETSGTLTVLFLDLDRFKPVNDIHGHEAGDRVLVAFAERLRSVVRPHDLVARLGGDEFVVVCDDLGGRDAADALARRIAAVAAEPVALDGTTVRVPCSVGVVTRDRTDAGETAESLLAEADAAMYADKLRRRGAAVPPRLSVVQRRLLAEELAAALKADPAVGGLRMYAMPVVSVPTGRVVGVEALLRWQHPRLGMLTPDRFLHVVADAGLDPLLSAFVLDSTLHRWAPWAASLPAGIAVNLSSGQLADPGLPSLLRSLLEQTDFPPGSLVLEICEPALVERTGGRGDSSTAVRRLHDTGVTLAIDDFGTGASSLVTVRDLPVGTLKIDRSIVGGLTTDRVARGICEAVVALGRTIGLRIVAEGVESDCQHRMLLEMGVEFAQGHLYGRAVPADQLVGILGEARGREAVAVR